MFVAVNVFTNFCKLFSLVCNVTNRPWNCQFSSSSTHSFSPSRPQQGRHNVTSCHIFIVQMQNLAQNWAEISGIRSTSHRQTRSMILWSRSVPLYEFKPNQSSASFHRWLTGGNKQQHWKGWSHKLPAALMPKSTPSLLVFSRLLQIHLFCCLWQVFLPQTMVKSQGNKETTTVLGSSWEATLRYFGQNLPGR